MESPQSFSSIPDKASDYIEEPAAAAAKYRRRSLLRGLRILLTKATLIAAAIFTTVFLTVLLINNPNTNGRSVGPRQLEAKMRSQIDMQMRMFEQEHPELNTLPDDEADAIRGEYYNGLVAESGINLPFLARHLKWTLNALTFDWGRLSSVSISSLWAFTFRTSRFDLNTTLLTYLPFSVLLAVSSFALILLFGIPLALACTRHYGRWVDRLISTLAPLSSIPSWVMGIILIAIFAIELRVLPMGGIFDTQPPATNLGYIPIVLKHMVLPVAAIFLTNIFQLAYSWRTFFVTFSSEDYVDLGKAKGLNRRTLEKDYILRPSLPYVLTSFSLMFLSYWQISMALEVIFDWKGLGWLYIKYGLPNFFGESMYPGELLIALSMVVVLAYLLGITVFLLDIVYLWVDPRLRFGQSDTYVRADQPHFRLADLFSRKPRRLRTASESDRHRQRRSIHATHIRLAERLKTAWGQISRFFGEVKRYPSALFGLAVILFLLAGSIYAVTALPYEKIGEEWGRSTFTGQPDRPKLAQPGWINWFRIKDYLSTISLSTRTDPVGRDITPFKDGFGQVSYTLTFNYGYADFPSEVLLYVEGIYERARPFVSLEWITPDGRVIPFRGLGVETRERINLGDYLSVGRILNENPAMKQWFVTGTNYPTPAYYLLFADPYADKPEPVSGTYQLVVTGTTFEAASTIQADLYLFGQVYGLAGTDAYRRDLTVPLVWGMPSALLVGLTGSILTGILSMLLAAAGAWYGGWVDNLVQRASEINLILPILAVAVLGFAYLGLPIWAVIGLVILSNIFGTPTKNFRAAFLQIRSANYVEAAQVYGASNLQIILRYLMPRIITTLIPQIILLIPYFVFLEATLGLFNISSNYPTWGKVIYQALMNGAWFGSRYWALQPIVLLMITGLGFSMFGIALEKILNPRLSS